MGGPRTASGASVVMVAVCGLMQTCSPSSSFSPELNFCISVSSKLKENCNELFSQWKDFVISYILNFLFVFPVLVFL